MSRIGKKMMEEIHHLADQPEESIDVRGIPEVKDWRGAERGRFYRPVKQQVTLRIDADLLDWFKSDGEKYQTRINAVLREYVEKHRKTG